MKKWLPLTLAVGLLAYLLWPASARHYSPGVLAPVEPQQTTLEAAKSWREGDYEITPLAEFQLEARVLSTARYRWDREADLSPVDFALGWGAMSDQAVLDKIRVSQSGRWYYWRTNDFPISRGEIESHSANMHMIPASHSIERRLKTVRIGDIVSLRGYLVVVKAGDGWRWQSSLSRTDTGASSCELVWVEDLTLR